MVYAEVSKQFYCGLDLHGKTIYVCIMNKAGRVVVHREIPASLTYLLRMLKPYVKSIAVCAESTFNWYWVSDGLHSNHIPFYLGHALYIKAIHSNKKKDDRIDAKMLADLLRTQLFPLAYAYPQQMRETRDLLRRRHRFVCLRGSLVRHIKILLYQQGYSEEFQDLSSEEQLRSVLKYSLPSDVKLSIEHDLGLMRELERSISKLEYHVLKSARHHDQHALALLFTIKGLGNILSLTILYEINTITRFESAQRLSSYSRVVKTQRQSAGKRTDRKNQKIGNPLLNWAFMQLAFSAQRFYPEIKTYTDRLKRKFGDRTAFRVLAHKFVVAIYYMLKNNKPFDVRQFVGA